MVKDEGFRDQLGKLLCGLNEETVRAFQNSVSTTAKADPHNTPHPGMITEMLTHILAAHGEIFQSKCTTKHTREQVYLCDGAKRPWRRSPLWLVIRVVITRALGYAFPLDMMRFHYKKFMLYFLAQIAAKACREQIPHEHRHLLSVKLARRLAKLHPHGYDFVADAATTASKGLNLSVQAVWAEVQKTENDARLVPKLDMKASSDQMTLQLDGSRRYVSSAMATHYTLFTRSKYKPRIPKSLLIGKGQFLKLTLPLIYVPC